MVHHLKTMIKSTNILCENCHEPSAMYKIVEGTMYYVRGTFRILGRYKYADGRRPEKAYAHYPSCKHLTFSPVRVVV